ncbi:MAG: hypothetical protein PHV20_08135 [Bacteroidales bacterium]|nr:hypothetical protein [Bacteroidales bacterium]
MIKLNIPSNWVIVKSDLLEIEEKQDNSLLIEDLFQIKRMNYLIDAGWYDNQNAFVIYLIQESSWDDPIIKIKSNDLQSCIEAIQFSIYYVDRLFDQSN